MILPRALSSFVRLNILLSVSLVSFLLVGCGGMSMRGRTHVNAAEGRSTFWGNGSKDRQETLSQQPERILPKLSLRVTPEVRTEIRKYTTSDRGTVKKILNKGQESFDPIKRVLRQKGIPEQLVSVAAVESGLNQYATSPAGAKGLWQFMKRTAQSYGLEVSRSKDERFDFMRSTEAAALHLRDLFEAFEDWYLALAAYNAGRGAINRILAESNATSFWELYHSGRLPKETKQFVPKVIAMSLIVEDPDGYGFRG